jgi:glycosyltransferase involved in cell wall biosynthesis
MVKTSKQPKICILTTVSLSIKSFYRGQLEALQQAGFDVTVVCARDESLPALLPKGVHYRPVPFLRVISPLKDLMTIVQLVRIFRKERFDIVQYSTPKASLLGSIAAFLARSPNRLYILWGLYYMGAEGFKYRLFKGFEKLICRLSHRIIPISHEMVEFAVGEGLGTPEKYQVMLNGSACGVDLELFDPAKWSNQRNEIRKQFDLPENAVVVGTVARLTGDKGINELVQAFDRLVRKKSGLYLLLVGTQEEKDRLSSETDSIIHNNPCIRLTGWQDNPLPFYAAMDIFCLPTYREGFGEVNLEAQAMGLPVVSTDVIGPRESLEHNVTGILVPPKSGDAVFEALLTLVSNSELQKDMGQKGRLRVQQKFGRKAMIHAIVQHRLSLLGISK